MSAPAPQGAPGQGKVPVSGNVLIIALCAVFCVVVAVCGFIFVGADESKNPIGLVALLLTAFASFLTGVAGLLQGAQVKAQLEQLANGAGDRKIQAALHTALDQRDEREKANPET